VVKFISDKIGVMYLGAMMEFGTKEAIFSKPLHPYTKALFNSLPSIASGRRLLPIEGLTPDPANLPTLPPSIQPPHKGTAPGRRIPPQLRFVS
jgi:peptide/nickel transport system ATP-binding protein